MYIDKPMKGHNLMQAIARINRVYFEKQGGLIVDYLGVAHELKEALNFYSQSGGKGNLTLDLQGATSTPKPIQAIGLGFQSLNKIWSGEQTKISSKNPRNSFLRLTRPSYSQ
ncbi:MAG TPA: hypothetical protein V6D16_18075 [Candidatus Obscuribacterales bacterium]